LWLRREKILIEFGILRKLVRLIKMSLSETYSRVRAGKNVSDKLPVVLYGCETRSLTFREERKLRVFENMVLRRIFGPRREEVMGEWRKLHKEELNDL